jgi:hypothetical protein
MRDSILRYGPKLHTKPVIGSATGLVPTINNARRAGNRGKSKRRPSLEVINVDQSRCMTGFDRLRDGFFD